MVYLSLLSALDMFITPFYRSDSRRFGYVTLITSTRLSIHILEGITTDLLVYSIIIPVLPFQLEHLGYNGVSGLVGWLLFAYVSV